MFQVGEPGFLSHMNKWRLLGKLEQGLNVALWVFSHVVCVGVPIAVIVARSLPVGPRCGRGLGLTFPFAGDGRAMWALLIFGACRDGDRSVGAAANARHFLQIHDQSERAKRGRIEK